MKKFSVGLIVAASVLMLAVSGFGATASAADLQAASSADPSSLGQPSGNSDFGQSNGVGASQLGPASTATGTSLQPAGGASQANAGNLSSASISDFLGSNPNATITASPFSTQEIMGEADPGNPTTSSTNWPEIGFFIALGLAVILASYLAIQRFRSSKANS